MKLSKVRNIGRESGYAFRCVTTDCWLADKGYLRCYVKNLRSRKGRRKCEGPTSGKYGVVKRLFLGDSAWDNYIFRLSLERISAEISNCCSVQIVNRKYGST